MIVVIDSQTGKVVSGPGDPRPRLRRGRHHLRRDRRPDHRRARQGGLRGRRRHLPAPADHPPRRRPLGQRHAPPPSDDHPGRPRGLGPMRATQAEAPDEPISYEQWGVDFFPEAISEERVLGAVNTIAGQPIDFGPIGRRPGQDRQGPGVRRDRRRHRHPASAATRSATGCCCRSALTFEVDLQVETHRFEAELLVPLTLTAVALQRRTHLHRGRRRPAATTSRSSCRPRGCGRRCSSGWSGSRAS